MNSTQNVLPPTQHRVSEQTRPRVHARIWEQTRRNVEKYSSGAGSERNIKLTERLKQLDREWDTERMLEANASAVILICLTVAIALTIFLPERSFGKHASPVDYVKAYPAIAFFAAFPIVVAAFLLQHALQGWCPPLPVFRYFGYRSAREIYVEKMALKALRGDFGTTSTELTARDAFERALQTS